MVEKWEELSRKILFEEYGRGIVVIRYRLPDGREEDFYIKHERPFVRIIAITDDNKVIAVRKFEAGIGKVLVAPPAGYIKADESPQQAAEREFLEETGYEGDLRLAAMTHSDGYTDVTGFVFVTDKCKKVAEPTATKTEFLEVVFFPVQGLRELIKKGGDFSSDTQAWYLGLDYLGLL